MDRPRIYGVKEKCVCFFVKAEKRTGSRLSGNTNKAPTPSDSRLHQSVGAEVWHREDVVRFVAEPSWTRSVSLAWRFLMIFNEGR